MSTKSTLVNGAQWRVAGLSILAAVLSVSSSGLTAHDSLLTWRAALTGVIVLAAGLQLLLAVRQERMAGLPDRRAAWLAVIVILFAVGTGFVVIGGFAVWRRLATG